MSRPTRFSLFVCDKQSPYHRHSPRRTQLSCYEQSSCHEPTSVNRQLAGCDHPHYIDKSVCNVYNSSMGSNTNCKYAFKGKCFSFAHHNINRLYHKLDEIRTYLHSFYPFNVYCCCETFLNNTISDQDILIEGYKIVRRDRTQCGGGGLLVYIMNNIDYTRRCDLERNDIEVIWKEKKRKTAWLDNR